MKIQLLTLSSASLFCAISMCTADSNTSENTETETIQLFNGKDLTGWKIVGGTGEFKVEDGCIVGAGENVKANTFLRTEQTFKDFEFTYEFKFDDLTGNSGVMYRANQRDGDGKVFGYQCELDNNTERAWSAGLYDESRRGWLSPTKDKSEEATEFADKFTQQGIKIFKWDGWNKVTIRCQGNHIQTWLNGELRVDFKDTDPEHDTREGFFGLQVHSGKSCKVRWRNLVLKPL